MNKAYALIHKSKWPIDGETRLSCFPTWEMARQAAIKLVEDGKQTKARLFRLKLSDLVILEVKKGPK